MFTHIMVGTNDLSKTKAFYDAALCALGVPAGAEHNGRAFYSHNGGAFGIGKPADGNAANAFHAAGLANGGSDAGEPGLRPNAPGKAYGAYLRDPDGHKICAFCQLKD
jgi:catechol 2,3-dioxygenase-like lactoylglutathione lyase family enzyme